MSDEMRKIEEEIENLYEQLDEVGQHLQRLDAAVRNLEGEMFANGC